MHQIFICAYTYMLPSSRTFELFRCSRRLPVSSVGVNIPVLLVVLDAVISCHQMGYGFVSARNRAVGSDRNLVHRMNRSNDPESVCTDRDPGACVCVCVHCVNVCAHARECLYFPRFFLEIVAATASVVVVVPCCCCCCCNKNNDCCWCCNCCSMR